MDRLVRHASTCGLPQLQLASQTSLKDHVYSTPSNPSDTIYLQLINLIRAGFTVVFESMDYSKKS